MGDDLWIEFLEGKRGSHLVKLVGLADDFAGIAAYMDIHALNRLMGEGDVITGASNVSNAMGFGKKAARNMDLRLMGTWRWDRNPFVGTRPWSGLLVLMVILSTRIMGFRFRTSGDTRPMLML